jgi:hypothetical protein
MIRLIFSCLLANAIAVTATTAMARSRHYGAPSSETYFHGPTNDANAFYNPAKDPNAVYYGGTYAGSDPDPNIRAALIREFGRQMRN